MKKKFSIVIMVIALIIFLIGGYAIFANDNNIDNKGNIVVNFSIGNSPTSDVKLKLFKIANIDENGKFTLYGDFADYPIVINNLDSEGYRKLASTLESYIAIDNNSSILEKDTNQNGQVNFSNLDNGLYLITGNEFSNNEYKYIPSPILVSVPTTNNEIKEFDIELKMKYSTEEMDNNNIKKEVIIVWNNDSKTSRPKKIIIQLFKDGVLFDTAILNEENGWKYKWNNLSSNSNWNVRELEEGVGSNYTSTIEEIDSVFFIEKTFKVEEPDKPDNTEEPGKPEKTDDSEKTEEPIELNNQNNQDKQNVPSKANTNQNTNKLPATGAIWWPVPILVVVGIIMIIWGVSCKRDE